MVELVNEEGKTVQQKVCEFFNFVYREEKLTPKEWAKTAVAPLFYGKSYAEICQNCR